MRPSGRVAAVLCLALLGLGGCWQRPARTVAEAHERFRAAMAANDPAALYQSLDQQSRWSVLTIQKYYREVREVVVQGYPPEARDRELERTDGASRRPADFFAAQAARRGWLKRFAGGAAPAAATEEQGRVAVVKTAAGGRFEFAFTERGGWGFAGLQAELEELKRRAANDVGVVKENARVYRGAGSGAAAPAGGATR